MPSLGGLEQEEMALKWHVAGIARPLRRRDRKEGGAAPASARPGALASSQGANRDGV